MSQIDTAINAVNWRKWGRKGPSSAWTESVQRELVEILFNAVRKIPERNFMKNYISVRNEGVEISAGPGVDNDDIIVGIETLFGTEAIILTPLQAERLAQGILSQIAQMRHSDTE